MESHMLDNPESPQWMSITGQPINVNLQSGFLGLLSMETRTIYITHLLIGRCTSIECFEKLNQLGEGSKYEVLLIL